MTPSPRCRALAGRFLRWLALVTPAFLALSAPADDRPLSEQAYAGVSLRDNPEGTVIGWVRPGPFNGTGFESPTLRRADLLVSANGQPVNAEGFASLIATLKPGDELTLIVKRGPGTDAAGAVPRGDPDAESLTFSVRLDSRDRWTGTIGRGSPVGAGVREPAAGEFEARIRALAEQTGTWVPAAPTGEPRLESLLAYLRSVQGEARDAAAMRPIVDSFRRPLSVDRVERDIAARIRTLAADPSEAAVRAFAAWALAADDLPPDAYEQPAPEPAAAVQLVRHLRDSVSLEGEHTAAMIAVINRAAAGLAQNVIRPATRLSAEEAARDGAERAKKAEPLAQLPAALAGAVTGDILYAARLDDGRFSVIGGAGDNTYRMDVVEVVYDTGGNDTYAFPSAMGDAGAPAFTAANHAIVDLAGDDTYASESDFHGPGVALFGNAVIDDRAGNDTYRSSKLFGIAAGLFGIGVILDRAGDDRYENTGPGSGWSQGVGFYGVGLLIDQSGNDRYLGEKLCQGVGAARGFGAIIDASGHDDYRANGPNFKSAYGTPDVFLSMSQGFGVGIRGYASGGVGAIYDLAGNDHYDAGEFSQACGYFFALGVLHDADGDDVYDGNRYSQAASAHQAVAVLIDDAGDDRYKGMTAASQAGAWDQSVAMLVDRAGNDSYTADGLSQGAAAQQAVALLIDLAGKDRYQAAGGEDASPGQGASVQGCSGGNEYHFAAAGQRSFSMLLDAGAGRDVFSTARRGVLATGARNEPAPAHSTWFGAFVDEEDDEGGSEPPSP